MQSSPDKITPCSPWVAEHLHLIGRDWPVLDLAAGSGRHTRLMLERGYQNITAADIDTTRLADLARRAEVTVIACDLEGAPWPFAPESFAGIIVTNYLWRPGLASLIATLRPGGVLIYETFMQGQEKLGRPRNPDFLLQPGELRRRLKPHCEIVAFREGPAPGPAMRQAIVARRLNDDTEPTA